MLPSKNDITESRFRWQCNCDGKFTVRNAVVGYIVKMYIHCIKLTVTDDLKDVGWHETIVQHSAVVTQLLVSKDQFGNYDEQAWLAMHTVCSRG